MRLMRASMRPMAALAAAIIISAMVTGCVKTLRGITAPGILGPAVIRRAEKRKNLSSARHHDQIRFRFYTTKFDRIRMLFAAPAHNRSWH
jgi:hypothetical protein